MGSTATYSTLHEIDIYLWHVVIHCNIAMYILYHIVGFYISPNLYKLCEMQKACIF